MKKPEHLVKYKWIEDALRERIRKADADDTLPSERLLAEEFRTTPVTVRRALAELADDGLILRRPRRATRIVRRDAAIRVYGGNSEAVRQVFAQTLPRQFPGERFEFLEPVPLGLEAVFGRCDIMLAPTTVLHEYERYFAPLPPDVLHRILEKPGIGPRMLDIHRRAGRCYGIPILASAGGMQVNLALLREIGYGECPSSLDLPALLEIRRSLRAGRTDRH